MRKLVLLVVLMVLIPVNASAATWTVTPGGTVTAAGGDVTFGFENGIEWYCGSLSLPGVAATTGNPVIVIPESPGASFTDCTGPFGIVPTYTQIGDWAMHAESYDPVADVVTGTIQNVAFAWEWPACTASFAGTLDYRYDNATGQLEILSNPTLTDIYVDPQNDCFGSVGDSTYAFLDSTLTVIPKQRIVSS